MSRLFGALVFGVSVATTQAFVADINGSGNARRWALNPPDPQVPASAVNPETGAIRFHLDAAGSATGNAEAELNAIRAAFDQWRAVAGTFLKFEEGPLTNGVTDVNSADGLNTIFWARDDLLINGDRDNLNGVVALTYVAAFADRNTITDTDTVFNGVQYQWFTDYDDPTTTGIFVEAIALHEIGHFIGLNHSPVGGATLLFIGERGVNSQVGLATDDYAAAQWLYGTQATGALLGRVVGTVRLGATPVLGAAVFAEDANGLLAAGTVTRTNGSYELANLPPGAYRIRVAPLDARFSSPYLVRGQDISAAFAAAQTSFLASSDLAAQVTAAGTAQADFTVSAGEPLRIAGLLKPSTNLAIPAPNTTKPVAVQPAAQTVYLGVFTTAAIAADMQVGITGPGLAVGPSELRPRASGNLTLVAAPVTIAADALPGLRSFFLRRSGETAWTHGFLEVLPPFPDANFDGLDDRFQREYWPVFTAPEAAPMADPDSDGFNNRWEFDTGSVPVDKLSANFRIESVTLIPGGARVVSQTAPGKSFQLFGRETVEGSPWQAVDLPKTAAGATTEFLDAGVTNRFKFYRVQLLP